MAQKLYTTETKSYNIIVFYHIAILSTIVIYEILVVKTSLLWKTSLPLNFWLREKEHKIMSTAKCDKLDGTILEIYEGSKIPMARGEFGL